MDLKPAGIYREDQSWRPLIPSPSPKKMKSAPCTLRQISVFSAGRVALSLPVEHHSSGSCPVFSSGRCGGLIMLNYIVSPLLLPSLNNIRLC